MIRPKPQILRSQLVCSLCGSESGPIYQCETGHVCDRCAATTRSGRDRTSRAIRGYLRPAQEGPSRLAAYDAAVGKECAGVGPSTALQTPDTAVAASDAANDRHELLARVGVDAVAMGLDAANSIEAHNALEHMFAHQMAMLHSMAMNFAGKAALAQDPHLSTKLANQSLRCLSIFQTGMLALKRARSSGEQAITVQHVQVSEGGQAVIGNVQTTGGQGK